MARLQELVLDVWREAGRHTDMAASTTNIAQPLARWMPIAQVLVQRIGPERSCVETVGLGSERILTCPLGERSDCSPAHLRDLLARCHRGEATLRRHGDGKVRELGAAMLPGLEAELLVGPLVGEHGTFGQAGRPVMTEHQMMNAPRRWPAHACRIPSRCSALTTSPRPGIIPGLCRPRAGGT
jgi:hypothetical protein